MFELFCKVHELDAYWVLILSSLQHEWFVLNQVLAGYKCTNPCVKIYVLDSYDLWNVR